MKTKDFLKLDTWALVEKEWPNPQVDDVVNTGKVLGPFESYGGALSYVIGLGGGAAFWNGAVVYLDRNQALDNLDYEDACYPGYAHYFWYPEKLEEDGE